jgi:hypothetical protein
MFFENVFFHTGALENYQHYYHKLLGNCGPWERLVFDNPQTAYNDPSTSLLRFKITSNFITQLNDKIMKGAGLPIPGRSDLFIVKVIDDGSIVPLPLKITQPQVNNFVNIQVLPQTNQWFNKRISDDVEQDENNIELTCFMPTSPIINLEFQLRDILTDRLQPIVNEYDNKVFPSLQIVLDIY